jgi:hypothetical protein
VTFWGWDMVNSVIPMFSYVSFPKNISLFRIMKQKKIEILNFSESQRVTIGLKFDLILVYY